MTLWELGVLIASAMGFGFWLGVLAANWEIKRRLRRLESFQREIFQQHLRRPF